MKVEKRRRKGKKRLSQVKKLKKALKYKKRKSVDAAASCVSHISQLRHLFDNPTVQIEDQRVRNNISKIQLNPTVDEVTMTFFLKGFCVVKMCQQRAFGEGWPESWRSCANHPRSCAKTLLLAFYCFSWRSCATYSRSCARSRI